MNATTFLMTAELAERLIGSDEVADRWNDDSALDGYTVGGLAGHLARAVLTVERYLAETGDVEGDPTDAAGYIVRTLGSHDPVASDFHSGVRARGEETASKGPTRLVRLLQDSRASLATQLADVDPSRRLTVLDGTVLSVEDYLETRLLELVIHLDDLAVSLGHDGADGIPPDAYATVAAVLARVAVQRVGGLETIRSLSRRERHPEAVRAL